MNKLITGCLAVFTACRLFGATDVYTDAVNLHNVIGTSGDTNTITVVNDRQQELWIPIAIVVNAGTTATNSPAVITNAISFTSSALPETAFKVGNVLSTVGNETATALTSYPVLESGDKLTMTFNSTNISVGVIISKRVIPR